MWIKGVMSDGIMSLLVLDASTIHKYCLKWIHHVNVKPTRITIRILRGGPECFVVGKNVKKVSYIIC